MRANNQIGWPVRIICGIFAIPMVAGFYLSIIATPEVFCSKGAADFTVDLRPLIACEIDLVFVLVVAGWALFNVLLILGCLIGFIPKRIFNSLMSATGGDEHKL